MKNKRKIVLNNIFKVILLIFVLIIFLNLEVFAESEHFTIKVPEGYLITKELIGDTKLLAVRTDNKVNFNIQMIQTEDYYEYTEGGLKELIKIASTDMNQYEIGKVDGKIGKYNEYPCYELNYEITAKNTNRKMNIRQIYIYEDTYSYIITIGGESKELVLAKEIEEMLNSLKLTKYERNYVKNLIEEKNKEINKEDILENDNLKEKIFKIIEEFEKLDVKVQILISIMIMIVFFSIIFIIIKIINRRKIKVKNEKKVKNK